MTTLPTRLKYSYYDKYYNNAHNYRIPCIFTAELDLYLLPKILSKAMCLYSNKLRLKASSYGPYGIIMLTQDDKCILVKI